MFTQSVICFLLTFLHAKGITSNVNLYRMSGAYKQYMNQLCGNYRCIHPYTVLPHTVGRSLEMMNN